MPGSDSPAGVHRWRGISGVVQCLFPCTTTARACLVLTNRVAPPLSIGVHVTCRHVSAREDTPGGKACPRAGCAAIAQRMHLACVEGCVARASMGKSVTFQAEHLVSSGEHTQWSPLATLPPCQTLQWCGECDVPQRLCLHLAVLVKHASA